MTRDPFCAECQVKACTTDTIEENSPAFCPSRSYSEVVQSTAEEFRSDPELRRLMFAATRAEAEGYLRWTRVEDTIAFARNLGVKKLGIATCAGLLQEAAIAARIFRQRGFKVISVCCKVGAIDKSEIGLGPEARCSKGQATKDFEPLCMPLAQADILNECGTELNVLIGLCVGHDSIFYRRSRAPVTTLVAKDRVLAHNPVGALYTSNMYYRKLLE